MGYPVVRVEQKTFGIPDVVESLDHTHYALIIHLFGRLSQAV